MLGPWCHSLGLSSLPSPPWGLCALTMAQDPILAHPRAVSPCSSNPTGVWVCNPSLVLLPEWASIYTIVLSLAYSPFASDRSPRLDSGPGVPLAIPGAVNALFCHHLCSAYHAQSLMHHISSVQALLMLGSPSAPSLFQLVEQPDSCGSQKITKKGRRTGADLKDQILLL